MRGYNPVIRSGLEPYSCTPALAVPVLLYSVSGLRTDIRYYVAIFGTGFDAPVRGYWARRRVARGRPGARGHDGTDPPKLTFEARLSTLTLKVVPSGRLSRPCVKGAVSAPKWPNSRVLRSAGDRPGLGAGEGQDAERLPMRCEQLRRGAPACRYRRHRPGSDYRRRRFTQRLAHGECGAATSPALSAR